MVTERPPCDALDLPAVDSLVFGGHDIQTGSVVRTAERLHERNAIPNRNTLDAVSGDLVAIDDRIKTGRPRTAGKQSQTSRMSRSATNRFRFGKSLTVSAQIALLSVTRKTSTAWSS